jgi:hypothetical protein
MGLSPGAKTFWTITGAILAAGLIAGLLGRIL